MGKCHLPVQWGMVSGVNVSGGSVSGVNLSGENDVVLFHPIWLNVILLVYFISVHNPSLLLIQKYHYPHSERLFSSLKKCLRFIYFSVQLKWSFLLFKYAPISASFSAIFLPKLVDISGIWTRIIAKGRTRTCWQICRHTHDGQR